MYRFLENNVDKLDGFTTNVYAKHLYQVHKRNATLMAIPSMYTIAYGQRAFVCEEYNRFTFHNLGHYENKRQAYCTTIPGNRHNVGTV